MARVPETHYATTDDGVSIAYQTVGDGPIDLVLELESWGNVEIMWELDALADLFERLSRFSRLILHDRRATGLSGGVSFPNLETRARDLLAVLDAIRSPRAVLFGERTTGAAFARVRRELSHPSRIARVEQGSRDESGGRPSIRGAQTPEEHRDEAAETRRGMGSKEFGQEWLAGLRAKLAGDERLASQIARLDRHFMAPSTAAEWIQVESETDVTAVLPFLRCPTLVLDYEQSSTDAAAEPPRPVLDSRGAAATHLRRCLRAAVRGPRADRRRRQGVHRPRARRRLRRRPFSEPFCSPTSSARPNVRRPWATGRGRT